MFLTRGVVGVRQAGRQGALCKAKSRLKGMRGPGIDRQQSSLV